MRILTIHSDFIEVEPKSKAIKNAEDIESGGYMKINLSDFPDYFYFRLDPEKREEVFRKAANKIGSLPKVAKELDVSWGTLWGWYHGKRAMKLEVLKNVCDIAEVDINSIQKYIEEMKGDTYCRNGLKIRLPFEINEEWAYFGELLRTDGHIPRNPKGVEIANNDLGVIKNLEEFLLSIGINKDSIHKKKWNKGFYLKICNRSFAIIMNSIFEIPKGNKSKTIFIPDIIKQSPPNVIASALRGAFDGDGWSCLRSRRTGIQLKSKQYIEDICKLLDKLNISYYSRGPTKENKYKCEVTRQNNLIRFQQIVRFNNQKRRDSLINIIKNYQGR